MKIATWNVNSLNVRLDHVIDWIKAHNPDVLCLQETKQTNEKFSHEAFKAIFCCLHWSDRKSVV